MEIAPVETVSLLSKVAEQGALFAFMTLVIIGLCVVVKSLYARNTQQAEIHQKMLVDSTLAINNNTTALQVMTKQIERMNDVR